VPDPLELLSSLSKHSELDIGCDQPSFQGSVRCSSNVIALALVASNQRCLAVMFQ